MYQHVGAWPIRYKLVKSESISILPIIGSIRIKVSPLNWNFSTYNYVFCESLFYARYLFNIVYMRAGKAFLKPFYACKKIKLQGYKKRNLFPFQFSNSDLFEHILA